MKLQRTHVNTAQISAQQSPSWSLPWNKPLPSCLVERIHLPARCNGVKKISVIKYECLRGCVSNWDVWSQAVEDKYWKERSLGGSQRDKLLKITGSWKIFGRGILHVIALLGPLPWGLLVATLLLPFLLQDRVSLSCQSQTHLSKKRIN